MKKQTEIFIVKSYFGKGTNSQTVVDAVFKSEKKANALLSKIKKDIAKLEKLYDKLDFNDYDVRHKYTELQDFFEAPAYLYTHTEIEKMVVSNNYEGYYKKFSKIAKVD